METPTAHNEMKIMKSALKVSFLIVLLLSWFASPVRGMDLTLEQQMQKSLRESKSLLLLIDRKQQNGAAVTEEIGRLKALATVIKDLDQQLQERFTARQETLESVNSKARERQSIMSDSYDSVLEEYLAVIESLPDDHISTLIIENLKSILDRSLPERKLPILGSLPYRHLQLPSLAPVASPVIVPAYQGGNTVVADADLASTPEAPISLEIAQLAESLHWSPVEIYAWVKNNIRSEWYWGMMKGAEETLRQKSGNDADQAALLVALYRAAGYPARFVRGVIEFFPDAQTIKNQLGITDTQELLTYFRKAGIPCQPVIAGGRLANIQIEHIWVEAQIPYANYRGAIVDENGKTWLGLDTHIKSSGLNESAPQSLPEGFDLAGIRDDYLHSGGTATPLEFLRAQIEEQGVNYDDLLQKRTLTPEDLKILPASMQYRQVAVTGEFTEMPDSLRHRLRFVAMKDDRQFFDETFEVMDLSNRSIAVTYEPATVEDQEIINSYGGLDNTPAYLVQLRPVLTVDGKRLAVGSGGLAVGDNFTLTIEMIGPDHTERLEKQLIVGNLAVLGFSAQQAVTAEAKPDVATTGERLLYERAMSYIKQWNAAEEELASLLHLAVAHPMPTLVVMGGVVDVTYLLDTPHGFDWKGVYLDAALRATETSGPPEDCRLFMLLAALQGSVLEHRIFEDGFGVESISTAKLLALANADSIPLVVLDQSNLGTELPGLNLPENITADIENSINQGLTITIPAAEMSHEDWSGYGYLKEDPATGEAGWMLSGSIAGSMTVLNPDRWPDDYYDPLAHPFQKVNLDPMAAVEIKIVIGTDLQPGVVGKNLKKPLMVMAFDNTGTPVKDVPISFELKAGGGSLQVVDPSMLVSYNPQLITTKTDYTGIATINISLGTDISANPTSWNSTPHAQMVGENIVEAYTLSGLQTSHSITAFAFPDAPDHLNITGGVTPGEILTWSDTVRVRVEDRYNNSISNVPVTFDMGTTQAGETCALANNDSRPGLLVSIDDPCLKNNVPVYGDCGGAHLSESTWDFGSAAQVILGSVPNAGYPVTIKAGNLPAKVVTVASKPFGNCDGDSPPQHNLVLKGIDLTDQFGNIINAAKVGGSLKMQARMYMLSEQEKVENRYIDCTPSGSDTCPTPLGTRQYTIDTSFDNATVSFDDQAVTVNDGGLFTLDQFSVGDIPAKKTITIRGQATKTVDQITGACQNYADCTLTQASSALPEISITKDIYAIDIDLPQAEYTIPIDREGYAIADTEIKYTIQPAEYIAGNAMVEIGKKLADGSFQVISDLDSESSGAGFVTLARGFRFDLGVEYVAKVVLNKGSNAVEIVSQEISLKPLALDLRADFNHDGQYLEDDPLETHPPGLLLPLNSDDDDHDGVMDYDDGFNADGIAGNADDVIQSVDANGMVTTAEDDDLVEVHLTALPGNLSEDGIVELELIQGQDQVRVWSSEEKGEGNIILGPTATGSSPAKFWSIGHDIPDLGGLPKSIFLEGVSLPDNNAGPAILVTKYISPEGVTTEMDRLLISVYHVTMVPDYNRDGKIDDKDRNLVTNTEPWRFWVNDDDDNAADDNGIATDAANDLPGSNGDLNDTVQSTSGSTSSDTTVTKVGNIRDLIDFFPLYLDIHNALQIWKPVDGFRYLLVDADGAVDMFAPKNGGDYLEADKANQYLQDPTLAMNLVNSPVTTIGPNGQALDNDFLAAIAGSDKYGVILLEGRKSSNKPLILRILDRYGNVLAENKFPLQIMPVEEMYARLDLRSVAGGDPEGVGDNYINRVSGYPVLQPIDGQPYCQRQEDRILIWMHGYNVNLDQARATFAEVFKRFFQTGLNGRFVGISWYGDPPALGNPHYHQAVVNAFATAEDFANFINSLSNPNIPGDENRISIAAHSLGNLVVGEAIQNRGLRFGKYFAVDAAVALEAYGQTEVNEGMITVDNWKDYWDYQGTDSLGNPTNPDRKLLPSEWYTRFPAADNRSKLTWRKRLINVPSGKVYNFYSSTEDVLRAYPDDDLFKFGELIQQGLNGEAIAYLATSTWVKQEKFKGRRSILNIFDNLGGVSSSYCGWSFSRYWNSLLGFTWKTTPEEAANNSDIQDGNLLQSHPFFAEDNQHLFPNPLSLIGPGLDELTSDSGSDFVNRLISNTGLKDYYADNQAAQAKVKVSDWLLAEAFPATTLPMGANNNPALTFRGQNVDMSGVKDDTGGCCKTSEDSWPRTDRYNNHKTWKHSDYKDIPYQHTYEFYNNIKQLVK